MEQWTAVVAIGETKATSLFRLRVDVYTLDGVIASCLGLILDVEELRIVGNPKR